MEDQQKEAAERSKLFGIGRRKSAVAQVKLTDQASEKIVNGEKFEEYFTTIGMQKIALAPMDLTSTAEQYGMTVKVRGGGKHSQADAVRHGLARALLAANPEWRIQLKSNGMLTRDARVKERKKPGLKRARRAPQFSKR